MCEGVQLTNITNIGVRVLAPTGARKSCLTDEPTVDAFLSLMAQLGAIVNLTAEIHDRVKPKKLNLIFLVIWMSWLWRGSRHNQALG